MQPFLDYSVVKENKIPGHNVLLISAHPGDEALGAAGIILNHVAAGGKFTTLYCSQTTGEDVKDCEKTALMLGSKTNHFLPFSKGKLGKTSKFPQTLAKALEKINPDVILLPSMMETDPDNAAISQALVKIRKKINTNFMILAYSAWLPIMPNCIYDISQVWESKKKIVAYCSSLQKTSKQKDYVKIAEGINQYWGQIADPDIKYAEAFFMATAEKYISIVKKVF
jgi:LmbE family N-acetylglucosaminyl deacetylase